MIAQLKGTIENVVGNVLTVDVNGVGYELIATRALVESIEIGAEAKIVVHTEVREDAIRLFGFVDNLEKQVFNLLLLVKGVGAKTAVEILSSLDKRELLKAIASNNSDRLQKVKGIGKKTAERIILELSDKTVKVAEEISPISGSGNGQHGRENPFSDAVEALLALGFGRSAAEKAVNDVERSGVFSSGSHKIIEAGQIVREALRFV